MSDDYVNATLSTLCIINIAVLASARNIVNKNTIP